ncbi:MAG: B12-binding domain-containing radical SAM protein [Euryarchaeota archaeon]|nr:B12-binding domain-containing radical SAM protein [Euryarchaeota archaeon]
MDITKRILFFNAKREKCESTSPHLGLAMLAAVLNGKDHEVLVVDYQFKHDAPSPETFINEFKPDVIGLTLYTATMREAAKIMDVVFKFKIPIMVGGPHATLYYDRLDDRIDYIILGEAENVIETVVINAKIETKSQIIKTEPPDPKKLPYPDFTSFFSYNDVRNYPLLMSRGCPNDCNFCCVHLISTRKWRFRYPEDCVDELLYAKRKLPDLNSVIIYDDNPMLVKKHITRFIKMYLEKDIDLPLNIINTRADRLDEDVIKLLKEVKCPSIALGVESGDPEVFETINKGETLDEIKKTAKLIKKHKIPLYLCFVIGLEGDTLEKTEHSINFANKLKPDHIYWNMITPFRGTKIREWYDINGKVSSLVNHSSWVDGDFMCEEPCAETPEFTVDERKKAYVMAILRTNDTRLKLTDILRLIPYVKKYTLYKDFIYWLPEKIRSDFKQFIFLIRQATEVYREKGGKELIKRINRY